MSKYGIGLGLLGGLRSLLIFDVVPNNSGPVSGCERTRAAVWERGSFKINTDMKF